MVADTPARELAFIPRPDPTSMTLEQIIGQIQHLNPTASANYLHQFLLTDLEDYLERLVIADEPRGPLARFVRRKGESGVQGFGRAGSA